MRITSLCRSLEVPDGWLHFTEGRREVWQGPGGEELIVSGTLVDELSLQSSAHPEQRGSVLAELRDDFIAVLQSSAAHPELQTTEELHSYPCVGGGDLTRIRSKTIDGATFFAQGLHVCDAGVLVVTMEGPTASEATAWFDSVLSSIAIVSTQTTAAN